MTKRHYEWVTVIYFDQELKRENHVTYLAPSKINKIKGEFSIGKETRCTASSTERQAIRVAKHIQETEYLTETIKEY